MIFGTVILGSLCIALSNAHCYPPHDITWEGGALTFPSESLKKLYKETGEYIPKNMIAVKAVIKHDKIIMLTPRSKPGVPVSLVMYDILSKISSTNFVPFPNLEDHEKGNCQAIQNAVDMYLDFMGLLWVLDTGIVNNMELPEQLCQPKVVCISLISGRIVRVISLSLLAQPNSRLQNIVADYDLEGKAHLYISDAANRQVLVYNVGNGSTFRVCLPTDVTPTISPEDVMYMALAKPPGEQAVLYITYLNGPKVISIDTQYLKQADPEGEVKGASELNTSTKRWRWQYLKTTIVYDKLTHAFKLNTLFHVIFKYDKMDFNCASLVDKINIILNYLNQNLNKINFQNEQTLNVGVKSRPIIFLGTNQYSKIFFRYEDNSSIYVWDTTKLFDLDSLSPIYTSDDCFIPTAVLSDKLKCYKVLESTYLDYYDGERGFGAMQQLVDLTKDC